MLKGVGDLNVIVAKGFYFKPESLLVAVSRIIQSLWSHLKVQATEAIYCGGQGLLPHRLADEVVPFKLWGTKFQMEDENIVSGH